MKLSFCPHKEKEKKYSVTAFLQSRMVADLNYNEAQVKGMKQKHSMRFADYKSLSQRATFIPVNAPGECTSYPIK